jgi:transglutaminase-like putative cysteine protease
MQGAQFGLMMVAFMFVALLDLALLNLYAESLKASGHLQKKGGLSHPKETSESSQPRIRVPIRRDLFRQVFRMGMATLVLTAIVFFMMPRLGRPAWRGDFFPRSKAVGFNRNIELGQLGTTINNPTEVLRLKLTDPNDPKRVPMRGEIYLHGIVFNQYENRHWSWNVDTSHNYFRFFGRSRRSYEAFRGNFRRGFHEGFRENFSQPPRRGFRRNRHTGWYSFYPPLYRHYRDRASKILPTLQDGELPPNTLVQEIIIEPLGDRELFAIKPYDLKKRPSTVSYDSATRRLLRGSVACRDRFTYKLYTTGIVNQTQIPYYVARDNVNLQQMLTYPKDIPAVVNKAKQWIEEANLSSKPRLRKAQYITEQLSDPKQFSYNLNSRREEFSIDPIEDFVKNNPEGHCEYFATTLAMMLRSQGIPCRLVVGFKSDEYNPTGNFYRVRQMHAHTWVEVLVNPKEAGIQNPTKKELQNGVWYRLDPTPISNDGSSEANELLLPLAQLMNWFDSTWNKYVMEMDRSRQKTAIYQPIVNWLKGGYAKVTDPEWWRGVWKKTKPMLNPKNWNTEKWISWRGGLIGIAIMLTMVVIFKVLRWFYRLIAGRIRKIRAEKARRRRIEVEFYRRFLLIAARLGLSRKRGETAREFACSAGPKIAKTTKNHELEPLPSLITEAYYQVRFGQSPLDKTRQKEIELAIGRLETAIEA